MYQSPSLFPKWLVIICQLISTLSSATGERESYQLLWVEDERLSLVDREIVARHVRKIVENDLGLAFRNRDSTWSISKDEFDLWRRIGKTNDPITRLWQHLFPISVGDVDAKSGRFDILEKEVKRFLSSHLRGQYGTHVQRAKLTLAALEWRKGKHHKATQLIREAKVIHPLGELVGIESRDDADLMTFEAIVQGIASLPISKICLLEIDERQNISQLWVNGFKVDSQLKQLQEGLNYLMARNQTGAVSEKILRCNGGPVQSGPWTWNGPPNSHHVFAFEVSEMAKQGPLLIFDVNQKGLTPELYFKKMGFMPCPIIPLKNEPGISQAINEHVSVLKKCLEGRGINVGNNNQSLKVQALSLPSRENETVLSSRTELKRIEEKWYNKSLNWLIVGTLVATVASSLLIKTNSQTSQSVGIKFENDSH